MICVTELIYVPQSIGVQRKTDNFGQGGKIGGDFTDVIFEVGLVGAVIINLEEFKIPEL